MKRILTLISVFISFVISAQQQNVITGQVSDIDGNPIEYANVVLLSPNDSTYLTGTITNENGKFSLQYATSGIIKTSHAGYTTSYNTYTNGKDLTITLHPDTVMLNELTVTSSKPLTRIDGDALVTTIRGTVLENAGTAKDVLGYIPGIINNFGSIEVIGKGSPTFYINGRKIRNGNEIDILKSEKIKRVELVTNPGARYDSSVNAVIRIIADREPGEGFGIDNTLRLGYRDFIYEGDDMNINYRNGNLDIFTNLQYAYGKSKGHSRNLQNTFTQSHYLQDIALQSIGKSNKLDAQIGADYTISSTSSLGVFYKITHTPSKKHNVFSTDTYTNDILNESGTVDQRADAHSTSHIVDGYYTATYGKWTFDAAFDILWQKSDDNSISHEKIANTIDRQLTNKSDVNAHMVAADAHISRPWLNGKISFGAEFTSSHRTDDFVNTEHLLTDNDILIKEQHINGYIETTQKIGNTMLQLGLRYEHVENKYHEYDKYIPEQSGTYNKLLPSATLVLPLGQTMLQLSYSRKYRRPLYSQLSSNIYYVNRYMYQCGNPLLKPEYTHDITVNYRFRDFTIMSNYSLTDNKIISSISQYGENSSATLIRKDNSIHDLHSLQVFCTYMPQFGRYVTALSAGALAQFYKIDYLDNKKKMNDPMWLVQWKNIYVLSHSTRFEATLQWRSSCYADNISMGHTWQIGATITKTINRHWQVKLIANDILNTARKIRSTIYSDCRNIYLEKYANTRSVEVNARYMFNTTKAKYKGKGAGNNEKSRL